jgi:hypothetical protein
MPIFYEFQKKNAHILYIKKSKLHGITTQKITLFILTIMRTSNPTTFNWAK